MPTFNIGNTAPLQVPLTNGVIRSFGHVRMTLAGIDFTGGFAEVKRSRKRNRELVRSNSPDPIGKTLGENEYQASVILYYDWFMNLLQTVQKITGKGYGDTPFLLQVSYVGANLTPYTDQIINCTFDSTDATDTKGTGALTRAIELTPTKILFGGFEDLDDPLVAPAQ